MDNPSVEEIEKAIWDTFNAGGSHAHNIIGLSLQNLAKTSRKDADRIYAELVEEGF